MMKKFLFVFILSSIVADCFAQFENPVKWDFSAKKINATTYEVHLTAKIEDEWHIYSQATPDGGPVATSISFNKNPLLSLDGTVKESGKLEEHFEELFGVQVKQFSDKVEFIQTVKLKAKVKTNVTGSVEFMTCNDHQCMPPKTVSFNISLK
jgi:thiol:disulfide interchange protein DsbD